jgi:hypothetical protein
MKFLVTVLISGVLAWFVVRSLRTGTAAPEAEGTPRANTETPAVLTAPTVSEITAMAPEKRLSAITRFSQLSSVREIMEALGQLDELPRREAGLASQVLFKRWAELAPEQAMRYVLAKQNGDSSVMFDEFKVILNVLRTTDPAHPLDLLIKCNPDYFNGGWTYGIDFATLQATLERYPEGELASDIAHKMWRQLIPTDPETGKGVPTPEDLASAAEKISKMPEEIRGQFYGYLAGAWAEQGLASAIAWAKEQPPEYQDYCIASIVRNRLKSANDLPTVEAIFSHVNDSGTLKELLANLGQQNPQLALAWFTAHADDPAAQSLRRLQEEALRSVADANPELALRWLESHPRASEVLRNRTLYSVVAAISSKDPRRALELATGLSKANQISMNGKIAPDLAKLDLEAGMALALKGGDVSSTLARILRDWKSTKEFQTQGLQPMIDKLSALAPEKLGEVIHPSLFKTIPAYKDFLNQLTPAQRDGALEEGANALLSSDLTAAANYFAAQAPGQGRSAAMAEAAVTFAETNPAAGTAWLASLPEDKAKPLAIRNFANSYFKSHSAEATAWMESLPATQADTARSTYVGILNNSGKSADAWEQALKLSTSDARDQSLAEVLSGWKDPAAAQAALSASNLDAKTKQTLSEQIYTMQRETQPLRVHWGAGE